MSATELFGEPQEPAAHKITNAKATQRPEQHEALRSRWSDLKSATVVSEGTVRLDRLKVIDYRPPDRVRKLTKRNFSWRQGRPRTPAIYTRFMRRTRNNSADKIAELAGLSDVGNK